MHPLRRDSPGARRPVPRAAAMSVTGLAALAVLATGCAQFNATFGKQEAVVQFKSGTTNAARLTVRAACSHIPAAKPEALPTDHLASDILYNVIYRVDKATNAEMAQLEQCLQKYPSVVGVDIQTPGAS